MSLTDRTKPTDVALNTDLYELTMAQGFWESGMRDSEACFNVFFRDNPFDGGYAVCCGTGQIADMVESFVFDDEAIEYLASLQAPSGGALFKKGFLDYLADYRLHVDMWAVPEGQVVFPREPLVRVEGPIIDCQLLETCLLNLVNFQTLVATKTARVVQAAEGHAVSDFGLRRAQGPDGGLSVARASYVGGASSTSNCLAGRIYGIPVFGTHAHSWVMAFPTELEAFRAFAESSPKNCVLLLDTYDVHEGVKNAITVAKEMEAAGERLAAVRIDSGDLAKLSKYTRKAFDDAGLPYVKISASNDLDEYTIQSLFAQGAPIDSFGVGTKLATCDPQPSLGGVYKLSAVRGKGEDGWTPAMKLSEQAYKRTIPGRQHIVRYLDEGGCPVGDVIVDDAYVSSEPAHAVDAVDPYTTYDFDGYAHEELHEQVVADGRGTGVAWTLEESKRRCRDALMHLDPAVKRFLNPQAYPVGIEQGLSKLRTELAHREREHSGR
ncbi:MAG: nicotinate phosphoribosyltransferase [Atopobiaceae bacterium]|jgi:nicotinate phosphoribosyltransferase|nr:nicotinate phosphoribosyltransferase [Atopobiaceae bacterium]MCH4119581.1 nicotinate phosphoribosyltransferase [Atopobiaceae bacterium]MCI1318630.1 nicotinate phosphoribosyltransferase [Atopobiaceae bacterium]MCI1389534.1 nicotinate phosphoribosyltransferase [Atopobiaceae bacterium]MCI1431598.1 nicotinate phosphoribosyltransferase [Atopobiaceae bacterium]